MIRKRWTWLCITIAILIVVVPWTIIANNYQPRYGFLQNGIAGDVWFVSAFFILIAAILQFPFKEEEAWTCACGYDLSFLTPESEKCPECGKSLQLEWTPTHGQYSRKTMWRIRFTTILFLLSGLLLCLGLTTRWMIRVATA